MDVLENINILGPLGRGGQRKKRRQNSFHTKRALHHANSDRRSSKLHTITRARNPLPTTPDMVTYSQAAFDRPVEIG